MSKKVKTLKEIFDKLNDDEKRELEESGYLQRTGRPRLPPEDKRRQIKIWVAGSTERAIRDGIGLKALGQKLDKEYGGVDHG